MNINTKMCCKDFFRPLQCRYSKKMIDRADRNCIDKRGELNLKDAQFFCDELDSIELGAATISSFVELLINREVALSSDTIDNVVLAAGRYADDILQSVRRIREPVGPKGDVNDLTN